MKHIKIFDTTLRDGEQSPGASLNADEKLLIAKQLTKLGVDVIEAGFPVTSPNEFEAVKIIAKEVDGPVICGLARLVKQDIERAWDAVQYSKKPRIHTFIATSKVHMESKLRKSKQEIMDMVEESVGLASLFTKDVEFSPEDASRTDIDYMCEIISTAIDSGATTINIPDTVGCAQPEEFADRIKYVRENVPEIKKVDISVHCHDDLGLAVANSLAGMKSGATQIECTINGIGERAGNAPLEEIVMNLHARNDFFKGFSASINTEYLFETSKMVSELTGLNIQRNKAIVGRNAFAHEAGVHQHAVLNNSKTYEIMSPESVGWQGENIVIGKHSGSHATMSVLNELGFSLSKSQISKVVWEVKQLADVQKTVDREEISKIAEGIVALTS